MKIGKDTLIFNMNSATDCPSKAKGLCKIEGKCYAMKAERMYKSVLPYRRTQEKMWEKEEVQELVKELRAMINRKRTEIKFIRFSEAGDFKSQLDVEKLKKFARGLKEITFYGYTARSDLEYKDLPENLVINGSSFMVDNQFTPVEKKDLYSYECICIMDCQECSLCKTKGNYDIKVPIH